MRFTLSLARPSRPRARIRGCRVAVHVKEVPDAMLYARLWCLFHWSAPTVAVELLGEHLRPGARGRAKIHCIRDAVKKAEFFV